MRAYVINLARSSERRAHMHAELAKAAIDYEIVEAVDGRALDFNDPETIAMIDPSVLAKKLLSPSQIANLLSHLRVYQKILADDEDHTIVLEDDVILPVDLRILADATADHVTEAEIALLSFDSKDACSLSYERSVQLPGARLLALPIDVNQPVSAAGHIITRKACERISELLPVRAQVDDWAYQYNAGMLDRVRCVVPLAVIKSPHFASTIERYPAERLKPHMLALLMRYYPSFFGELIALRRRRIWRSWTRVEFVDKPFRNKPSRLD